MGSLSFGVYIWSSDSYLGEVSVCRFGWCNSEKIGFSPEIGVAPQNPTVAP